MIMINHDDVTKWKHFPRYWPFVRGIHRSPVNSPHIGQWRGAFMFSLILIVHSCADQRKHESSASLPYVRGIHRRPVNSQHKWPVTRKMFPFDDVIISWIHVNMALCIILYRYNTTLCVYVFTLEESVESFIATKRFIQPCFNDI